MSKKKPQNEPPSLFDNLDLFAIAGSAPDSAAEPAAEKAKKSKAEKPQGESKPKGDSKPKGGKPKGKPANAKATADKKEAK